MNIVPITTGTGIMPFKSAFAEEKVAPEGNSFQNMFSDAVNNLEELNAIKKQDGIALSLGNIDDLGQMQTNSEKAEVALQLLVQMRNKVLDSYQEIMRISV